MSSGARPPFDPAPLVAGARTAYLGVSRALIEQRPDPARHLMTDPCWEQLRQHVGTLQVDGSRQHLDGLMITDVQLRSWEEAAGMHRAAVRLVLAGTRFVAGADGRLVTGSRHADQWAEDWRFVRSSDPQVLAAGSAARCPACGAPLEVDDAGLCRYCAAVVPGAKHDWLVDAMGEAVDDLFTGAQQGAIAQAAYQTVGAAAAIGTEARDAVHAGPAIAPQAASALQQIQAADPAFKVGDMAPLARQVFLAIDEARVRLAPGVLRPYAMDQLWAAEVEAARAAEAAGRHQVPAYLDIDSVEVAAAAVKDGWQELLLRVHVRSAMHTVDLRTGTVVAGDDLVQPWQADLTFVRREGVATSPYREAEAGICPACSATLQVGADGRCMACGRHLTGGEVGWVLSGIS